MNETMNHLLIPEHFNESMNDFFNKHFIHRPVNSVVVTIE